MNENKSNHECECHENHNHDNCGADCGCGHDHEHKEQQYIYLELKDGTELESLVLGIFEVDDNEYIATVPKDQELVYIYRYNEIDEAPVLSNIEDDNEFEKVTEVFKELTE